MKIVLCGALKAASMKKSCESVARPPEELLIRTTANELNRRGNGGGSGNSTGRIIFYAAKSGRRHIK
jgi:hypothetical protein